jgi:nicotinamide-nucleotide amidase
LHLTKFLIILKAIKKIKLKESVMTNINYSLSMQLGKLLEMHGLTLALAESCTGGGFAEEVTAVSGSSSWFDRGFVVYSNAAKQGLLDVKSETLEVFGAVSEQTAMEMALGVLKHSDADVSLSITGIAGPGGETSGKPVGTVWFGLARRDGGCRAQLAHFEGGRKNVRKCSIEYGLRWLLQEVGH